MDYHEAVSELLKLTSNLHQGGLIAVYGSTRVNRSSLIFKIISSKIDSLDKIIYIITDKNFSFYELLKLAHDNILVIKVNSFDEQHSLMLSMSNFMVKTPVNMIVVDSVTYWYRIQSILNDITIANKKLNLHIALLKNISKTFLIPIILSAHAKLGLDDELSSLVAYKIIDLWADIIIRINNKLGAKEITIVKRPKVNLNA